MYKRMLYYWEFSVFICLVWGTLIFSVTGRWVNSHYLMMPLIILSNHQGQLSSRAFAWPYEIWDKKQLWPAHPLSLLPLTTKTVTQFKKALFFLIDVFDIITLIVLLILIGNFCKHNVFKLLYINCCSRGKYIIFCGCLGRRKRGLWVQSGSSSWPDLLEGMQVHCAY